MKFKRASGILLHPSSLPGKYGIGDIGPQAHIWLDFLARSGCTLWQVLPLGPTGYGDSPYQCFSAFAGNPYMISPEALLAEDLLHSDDLVELPDFPADRVDFGQLIPWKLGVLDRSYLRFENMASQELRQAFYDFQEAQAAWLTDFALFMALKEAHGGRPWITWEAPLRDRDEKALAEARQKHEVAIRRQMYRQFLFYRQWAELHARAGELGIRIIGDLPIFVAHDSADVWAHPDLFFLDSKGIPTVQAGVPPDYFSPTGQLWGNPLYRWKVHAANGYKWWLERIGAVLSLVDIIRIDHFRGFAGYWEVPQKAETAKDGRWVPGPGIEFFQTVQNALGALPIIAEDLGVITPDVVTLREQFDLPGMKILQFAFGGGPNDPYLPHNFLEQCVVYTGTHDNDTSRGWYERVSDREKDFFRRYFARDGSDVSWDMIRGAWSSVAVLALAPMQDFLSLGNEARMNQPGNPRGNWTWRMPQDALSEWLRARIEDTNYLYSRKEIENAPENIASSQKAVDYFL